MIYYNTVRMRIILYPHHYALYVLVTKEILSTAKISEHNNPVLP